MPRLSVAERYMRDVLAGKILTSKLVRLQIERHVADLKDGSSRGLFFDRKAARHVIDYFPLFITGVDGEYLGAPYTLPPWWQALLWILYGWKRKVGNRLLRRFKFAYVEVARGNLKSLTLSGLCLYELHAFGEPGATVYSAATDKKTAKLVFNTAVTMVRNSEWLRREIVETKENLSIEATASRFEPCASEDQNLMGLRPSFVSIDELHVHSTSGVWDVFYTAMGKKSQPLMFAITNSGFDRNSVCYKQREYSEKVLTGIVPADNWFAWVCGLDDEDDPSFDWQDERNWIKANPCLGGAVTLENLRDFANKAKEDPSSLNTFLRFHLCVWTTKHSMWMPMDKWGRCGLPFDRALLAGRRCFGGLDLSTTTDVAAFVLVFDPTEQDPFWRVLPHFFLPRENIQKRSRRDRVPYDLWARMDLFELTEGSVIDYGVIRNRIVTLGREFNIAEIAFDRWNSTDLVRNLENDGFLMVEFGQGFASMNAPTKRLMELVLTAEIAHGGNPVLSWMASNVIVQMDPPGNVKPDKGKSREKIDGIVALIMAVARGIVAPPPATVGIEVW